MAHRTGTTWHETKSQGPRLSLSTWSQTAHLYFSELCEHSETNYPWLIAKIQQMGFFLCVTSIYCWVVHRWVWGWDGKASRGDSPTPTQGPKQESYSRDCLGNANQMDWEHMNSKQLLSQLLFGSFPRPQMEKAWLRVRAWIAQPRST